jgi:hypothetical protein
MQDTVTIATNFKRLKASCPTVMCMYDAANNALIAEGNASLLIKPDHFPSGADPSGYLAALESLQKVYLQIAEVSTVSAIDAYLPSLHLAQAAAALNGNELLAAIG